MDANSAKILACLTSDTSTGSKESLAPTASQNLSSAGISYSRDFLFLEQFFTGFPEFSWNGPQFSGYDIETCVEDLPYGGRSGLNPHDTHIATLQIELAGRVFVVHVPENQTVADLPGFNWLKLYLYQAPVIKAIHNSVFEQSFALKHIDAKQRIWPIHDTQIAEYDLAHGRSTICYGPGQWKFEVDANDFPRQQLSLGDTIFRRYGVEMDKDPAVRLSFRRGGALTKRQTQYAAWDAVWACRLAKDQVAEMDEKTLRVFALDCDNVISVAKQYLAGVPLDKAALAKLHDAWCEELATLEEGLRVALYQPPDGEPVLTKTGKHKTVKGEPQYHHLKVTSDDQMPERLRAVGVDVQTFQEDEIKKFIDNPIAEATIRSKKLRTFTTRYTGKLGGYVHPLTGCIHAETRTTATATGRPSMDKGLQQIPKRDADGRKIRSCIRARPGFKLLKADFSLEELRFIAERWNEKNMKRALIEGMDLHILTGAAIKEHLRTSDWHVLKPAYDKLLAEYAAGTQEAKDLRTKAKCFHPDTEVLTHSGWKKITELQEGEEVIQATPREGSAVDLSWVLPTTVFTLPRHESGKLIHLKKEGIDIRVTPDHRMLVFRAKGHFDVVTPDKVPAARGWANAGMLAEGNIEVDEQLLRLAVALQADGSIAGSGRVKFGFSKKRKIERLRMLLAGLDHREMVYTNGKHGYATHFVLQAAVAEPVVALLDNKRFPWWWLNLTPRLRDVVLEEAKFWDATSPKRCNAYHYVSTQKQNADVLQAIAAISNKKSRMIPKKGHYYYNLSIKDHHLSRGDALKAEEQDYQGEVVCLSVPSSFVLVRDGGVPLITGQCPNFGLGYLAWVNRLIGIAWEDYGEVWSFEYGRDVYNLWHSLYPGVSQRHNYIKAKAKIDGKICVETIEGRRRWCVGAPEAVNHEIQGSCADLLKRAKSLLWRDCPPITELHDELVFEVRETEAEYARDFVKAAMEQAERYYLKEVPSIADVEILDVYK